MSGSPAPRSPAGAAAGPSGNRATYVTTPEVAHRAAQAHNPPLGEGDIELLVERFADKFMPDMKKAFDPDAFCRKMTAHMESEGLRPEGGRELESRLRAPPQWLLSSGLSLALSFGFSSTPTRSTATTAAHSRAPARRKPT